MNTNRHTQDKASQFRRRVRAELALRDLRVRDLVSAVGKSRNAISRAINRGEFPGVQKLIAQHLEL